MINRIDKILITYADTTATMDELRKVMYAILDIEAAEIPFSEKLINEDHQLRILSYNLSVNLVETKYLARQLTDIMKVKLKELKNKSPCTYNKE